MNIKTVIVAVVCLMVLGMAGIAQTPPPAANFFVGLGAGYSSTGYNSTNAQHTGILATLGVQPSGFNFWSITTLIMQPGSPSGVGTIRTGIGYSLKQTGNFNLIALADSGVSTTANAVLGNVGGGLLLHYDLGGIVKKFKDQGFGLSVGMRMAAISGTSVQPEYLVVVSKKF